MTDKQLAILGLAGGGLVAVGSLLPWATLTTGFGSISVAGTQGDGVFTLILGAVIALGSFLRYGSSETGRFNRIIGLLGVITAAFGVFEFSNVAGIAGNAAARPSVGMGIYLVIIGGLAALLSGQKGKPAQA